MEVLTVADLKRALEGVPDDFEIWISLEHGARGVVGSPRVDELKRRAILG